MSLALFLLRRTVMLDQTQERRKLITDISWLADITDSESEETEDEETEPSERVL
jgi:hypothetical protein